jgi:hypothetical protein
MSKKKTSSTTQVRSRKSEGDDPKDAAENRKFMIIMALATVALVAALYFLLR